MKKGVPPRTSTASKNYSTRVRGLGKSMAAKHETTAVVAAAAIVGAVLGAGAVLLSMNVKARKREDSETSDGENFTLLPPPNPNWTPGTQPTSPFSGEFESVQIADLKVAPFEFFMTAMGPRMFQLCSTINPDGTTNLAPVCYLGPVSEDDPHIVMGITKRKNDARPKDTQVNIDATGEFVLNVVSSWCCEAAEYTGKRHAPEVDEFEICGFTKLASTTVKPFRCKETAIQLECKVEKFVDLNDPDGVQASRVYIAKVRVLRIDSTQCDIMPHHRSCLDAGHSHPFCQGTHGRRPLTRRPCDRSFQGP